MIINHFPFDPLLSEDALLALARFKPWADEKILIMQKYKYYFITCCAPYEQKISLHSSTFDI